MTCIEEERVGVCRGLKKRMVYLYGVVVQGRFCRVFGDEAFELIHQHHALDELDITELRVPMYVGCTHQKLLTGLRGLRTTRVPHSILSLKQRSQSDVVLK